MVDILGAFNLLGIGFLLLITVVMLVLQQKIWNNTKSDEYVSKYPIEYISFTLHSDELNDRQIELLLNFQVAVFDSLGLSFGGGLYSFASYGCTPKQAEHIKGLLEIFYKAINVAVVIEYWEHHTKKEGENE